MTEINEDESQIAVDETAGSQLKAAREAVEMTIEEAAEQLHLLRETVIALEEDDASKLPSRVFTLGYLKNYARILDVPESYILGLLKEEVNEVEEIRSLQQPRAPKIRIRRHQQVNGGRLFGKLITGLILIAIIVLAVLWWRGAIQLPDMSDLPFLPAAEKHKSVETSGDDGSESLTLPIGDGQASQNETGQDVIVAADEAASKDSDEDLLELSLETAGDETTAEAGDSEDTSTDAEEASSETSGETSITSQTAGKTAVSDDVVVVVATDAAGETQAGGEHKVTLDFSDNCWVNVNDAEGKIVLFGDIPAGSSKTLEGSAPFTFVLGNAAKVKVSIDGRPYDIAPHIKGGVARFSLGEPVE
ncbi:MAG: helix-turn-helix domain-containing protein [Gammaproteobacteria bacterium]|nr:helix-turn-helix domain-containing protein [Gammaproteobacteria bacterium]